MPPIQDQTPQKITSPSRNRRPDAAKSDLSELEAHFRTNLKNGLPPKEAEKRLNGREDESLFEAPLPPRKQWVKPVFAEPVLWLFWVVCVVAVFFGREEIGILSLLLTLGHTVYCVILKQKALRLEADMQTYDIPLTRVIRNRRLLRVRGDRLVPGDIVLFRRGDRIPCDARLIVSRRLTVLEETLHGDDRERIAVVLEKDATASVSDADAVTHSPQNMVYAGGTVKQGWCRALVVAVGARTHLGGRVGKVSPTHESKNPAYLEKMKKRLSAVNLILAVAVIPLTALGVLTLGGRYGLIDIFLSTLAMAVMMLTEHTAVLALHHDVSARILAATDADVENSAEIRTSETAARLTHMDHLILVGAAALHDGQTHPAYLVLDDQLFPVDQEGQLPCIQSFTEKLFLFSEGQADRIKNGAYHAFPGLDKAVRFLCDWGGADTEALLLRLERMESKGDAVELQLRNEAPMTLYLTDDIRDLPECDVYRTVKGDVAPLLQEAVDGWTQDVKQAYTNGLRVQILISECDGSFCVEGFLAFSVSFCRKSAGYIQSLEAMGVTVTGFLRDAFPEDLLAHADAGLTSRVDTVDLSSDGEAVSVALAVKEGARSFVNCKTEQILSYIEELRQNGGCVGVLSSERVDVPLLEAADVAMTCMPAVFKDMLADGQPHISGSEGALPDGDPDSACASDHSRRMAHVVLRRCGVHGGGIGGVRHARLASARMMMGLRMSMRYLCLSQLLRLILTVLPLVTGTACLSAPVLLVSGMLVDLLAILCYCQCDFPTTVLAEKDRALMDHLAAPHRTMKAELILMAASSVIPFVIALLTRILMGSTYGDMTNFIALSLLATQTALFATGHMPKKHRRGFFVLVLMVCIYAGALSLTLASGLQVLYCLVLPLIQPTVWLLGYGILKRKGKVI